MWSFNSSQAIIGTGRWSESNRRAAMLFFPMVNSTVLVCSLAQEAGTLAMTSTQSSDQAVHIPNA